ncbi:type II secretion system F family protein [Rubrimonas cliftonensis]|uniref:Flp pilus assembly protein TadB n=1 Tax=Rubrimonas cliftonensis TaxID=89524 RepID=A0A1H4CJ50_9RHOB|nr:type II secretion system F family protein [Rubrimonas cliftonensis]SEA60350.1 Flp pilus assembly protein TadB [Rubrimonas cliftonensis]
MAVEALRTVAEQLALRPMPALGAMMVCALALALWSEVRRRAGPRARMRARLAALALRRAGRGPSNSALAEEWRMFENRASGFGGAALQRIEALAAGVGGVRPFAWLCGGAAFAGLAAGGVSFALGLPGFHDALIALGAALAAGWIGHGELRRRWAVAFLDQLVEAVELLGRAVRAGNPASGAVRLAGRELEAPVGPVFTRIADLDDLGVDLRRALRRAAYEVNLPDFTFLAIALVIQRETGGQISDSLDNLHTVLRKRKETRLKARALTAEGRMSATIVGLIPLVAGVAVYLLDPAQFGLLLAEGPGRTMLMAAVGLLAVGMLIVRAIVTARP